MKLTNVALAFAVLSLSVLSAPIAMIDERSPGAKADAKANADHASPIEVEGMLDAKANADHAYPVEVEGMLARLEKRGSLAQGNFNLDHA